MRKSILLLIAIHFLTAAYTQVGDTNEKEQIIRSEIISSHFLLLEKEGIHLLQNPQSDNQTYIDIFQLSKEDIRLKDHTDLSIKYRLTDLDNDLNYQLDISLFDENGRQILLIPSKKRGDFGKIDQTNQKSAYEFIHNDILESGVYYGQKYRLEVQCQLRGFGLNCSEGRPKFEGSLQKKWGYYVPAAAGLTAAIIGGITWNNYKSDYANYNNLWEDGHLLAEAQPSYDLAKTKQNRSKNLVYIGTGVVITSGLALLNNYVRKHLPKVNTYKKYCKRKAEKPIN